MPARHPNRSELPGPDPGLDDLRGLQPAELRAVIADIDARQRDLHIDNTGELRDLDAGEQDRFDRLSRIRDAAELRLREHEHIRAVYNRNPGAARVWGDNLGGSVRAGLRGGGDRHGLEARARQLVDARFDDGALPDYAAERAVSLLAEGGHGPRGLAAEYILRAGDPAYESAFMKACADPRRGHMLWSEEERAAYQAVEELRAAMGTGTTVGGDMIPLTLDPALVLTSTGSNNPLRQIARVVQTVTDSWQGVTTAGATAEWKAEQAQAADGSPGTVPKPIPVYFADVDAVYSYEVGMDAANFQSELRRVLDDAVTQLTLTAYTTGDGSGKPRGFVPNATAPSRTAGAFTAADVYLLQNSLPPRFSAGARWVANIAVINAISAFETTAGNLKFPEVRNDPPRLLTKPLHELSKMSADMSTAASRFLAYGNFEHYVIVDRVGSTLEILPGYGANQRPTGQRHAFLYFRTGGDLIVTTAVQVIAKS